jgi:hypothetical protein
VRVWGASSAPTPISTCGSPRRATSGAGGSCSSRPPAVLSYIEAAGIGGDREGPLSRPLANDRKGFQRKHLDRKDVLDEVKKWGAGRGSRSITSATAAWRSLAMEDDDHERVE